MLRKEFHYTDYEGKEKTLVAHFHLNKNDCIDLDRAFQDEGGLIAYLKKLLAISKENPEDLPKESMIRFIRLLVSKSYGERPDYAPSLFLKEDDMGRPLVNHFKGTPAYDEFIFDLLTGKEDFGAFADGILPHISDDQMAEARKMLEEEGVNVDLNSAPEKRED